MFFNHKNLGTRASSGFDCWGGGGVGKALIYKFKGQNKEKSENPGVPFTTFHLDMDIRIPPFHVIACLDFVAKYFIIMEELAKDLRACFLS